MFVDGIVSCREQQRDSSLALILIWRFLFFSLIDPI